VTLESSSPKPDNRHRLIAIGAPAAAAAIVVATALVASAAGGHTSRVATASHAGTPAAAPAAGGTFPPGPAPSGPPVLTTQTYTSPALGGGLYRPTGVSAASGTVFVSNTGANQVSALAGGTTTVVTGSLALFGEHGDGGAAASATVYHPAGTAADAQGDVFIADSGDNVVREVTAAGKIIRLAGTGRAGSGRAIGRASAVALNSPEGVAVTSSGQVYIADTDNNRVIRVNPAGQAFLVAGNGKAGYFGDGGKATAARLDEPTGVAVDAAGNVYVADASNNVIRRVALNGTISTVAGSVAADKAGDGLGGFSGDGGPATSAQLNDPQGVAVDGAGDLFIADTFNNAIREVTPAGVISTVVNASAAGAIPPSGGETSGGAPTASKLSTPYQVSIDPATSDLYTADTPNSAIAQVTTLVQPGDSPGPVAPAGS
jgi:hypothetical protein